MPGNPVPAGYHTVTPYLVAGGVPQLLDFLKAALGAVETERMAMPDGTVMHAEVRIGDSMVMMGEAKGEFKPMPTMLYLYVEDADAAYHRALRAGAASIQPPADQFYGDRTAAVKDPSGNMWYLATRKEEVTHDELLRRMEQRKHA